MSRFFKSAAFPILIVVVLAFFAQRLINTGSQEKPPTYSDFITQLQRGELKSVQLKTKDNTVVVTQRSGKTYETGYTDGGADRLDAQLQTAVQTNKLPPGGSLFSCTAVCSCASRRSAPPSVYPVS